MRKCTVKQISNELIVTISGQPAVHTFTYNSENEASLSKPQLRDLIWAIERAYKNQEGN